MSRMAKDRITGVIVTMASSAIMFLFYSLVNSFETKADALGKYGNLEKKIDIVICILKPAKCLDKKDF
jgi:hypothetical protein